MMEFICPTPHPSATASPSIFFNLLISCRLHQGVKDPFSFTDTIALLGRLGLGLGLRVRVSIRIIFTFFFGIYYKLIPLKLNCNKSRYERHLANVTKVSHLPPQKSFLNANCGGIYRRNSTVHNNYLQL